MIMEIIQQDQRQMEMPKNSKNQASNKFIIKPKLSLAHLRSENLDPQTPTSSDQEVDLFLTHMAQKSKQFKDLLRQKDICNQQQFCEKYLYRSVCLKTILKSVLDRMLSERRLGKNLKGLNKSNLAEIQGQIRSSLLREIQLYRNDREFRKGKEELQGILALRKQQILQQLQKLRYKPPTLPNKQNCQPMFNDLLN